MVISSGDRAAAAVAPVAAAQFGVQTKTQERDGCPLLHFRSGLKLVVESRREIAGGVLNPLVNPAQCQVAQNSPGMLVYEKQRAKLCFPFFVASFLA